MMEMMMMMMMMTMKQKILIIDDDPSHLDAIDTQQLFANVWFQTELGKVKLSGKCFKHFRLTANL